MNQILIIFAKKPELGKTKTRIAKEYGEEFALKFSLCCLSDLLTNVIDPISYKVIFITDNGVDKEYFSNNYHQDCIALSDLGTPKDLNEKFKIAFGYAMNDLGFEKVVLIPMDIPYLTAREINNAFNTLNKNNVVLGPENNGGVYLIGINHLMEGNIFNKIRWSTGKSYQDLLNNIDHQCVTLPFNNDLNHVADIFDNKEIIRKNCPNLYSLLISSNIITI